MADELELTPFQTKVSELILDTPAPGKHAAKSAIAHIQKAWRLRDVDREMSAFRAITGEEESATAIFHALCELSPCCCTKGRSIASES